ncbi:hypothetical protein H131_10098 [Lysinibacillus sphaericus OT4b.31]|uniref:Uncharacterized protein n=1 Tax=Lysinibacillus sphaericus OT4b.31 TaxID=1285586 RepID=R7ZEG0_LYSSH|nr:hypothetical protein H131_10098 [Lysinibacillus sphaericus OT4b.31]
MVPSATVKVVANILKNLVEDPVTLTLILIMESGIFSPPFIVVARHVVVNPSDSTIIGVPA